MIRESEDHLISFFRRFPGAVIRLSPQGIVMGTKGRLERELGRKMTGRPFVEFLDSESSGREWQEALVAVPGLTDDDAVVELILRGSDTLPEPRAFTVLWEAEVGVVWMLEHRPDPRLDRASPLQQIFLNLLSNAIRYSSHEGPRIRVGAREADRFYEFFVTDNGPGIAPELQTKIWTLFRRKKPRGEPASASQL